MKSVLISIKPKWCELIASGKKKVEVRKTRPKLETPFKCYIYCTKQKVNGEILLTYDKNVEGRNRGFRNEGDIPLVGKVIGEFVCDRIIEIKPFGIDDIREFENQTCLTSDEIVDYLNGFYGYGWHISDLVIYDKPKELGEFSVLDDKAIKDCKHRERVYNNPDSVNGAWLLGSYICTKSEEDWCSKCKTKPLKRPPQSWCYAEEVKADE